jgi:large subunit ribosomal protein L20
MVRVKRGGVARIRRKKFLKFAKGFTGAHSRIFRVAKTQVMKALLYSYVGRKNRKRFFRRLWICRINGFLSTGYPGLKFNNFKWMFKRCYSIDLNLKMISTIIIEDPQFNLVLPKIIVQV